MPLQHEAWQINHTIYSATYQHLEDKKGESWTPWTPLSSVWGGKKVIN